jgi:hypothetical protein
MASRFSRLSLNIDLPVLDASVLERTAAALQAKLLAHEVGIRGLIRMNSGTGASPHIQFGKGLEEFCYAL